jgi:hypothetical protein
MPVVLVTVMRFQEYSETTLWVPVTMRKNQSAPLVARVGDSLAVQGINQIFC